MMLDEQEKQEKQEMQAIIDRYLPDMGEGDTLASQAVTALCKLQYKWYNDRDVYDNVHGHFEGWVNDLSSFANWLAKYIPETEGILHLIENDGIEYEEILYELAGCILDEDNLARWEKQPKLGTVYDCDGYFEFCEPWDDEEDDDF